MDLREAVAQIRRDQHASQVVGEDQCLVPKEAVDAVLAAPGANGGGFDLARRCSEILEWRRTGLYGGTELERMAQTLGEETAADPPLSRAELLTIREALAFVAAFDPDAAR